MTRENYNQELNRLFGIKNIRDRIRTKDSIMSEVQIKRPTFANVLMTRDAVIKKHEEMQNAIFFDCSVCAIGKIMVDKRRGLQFRQCSGCQNVFRVKQTGMGNWKINYEPNVQATPGQSDF